jgi:hypothetical protein
MRCFTLLCLSLILICPCGGTEWSTDIPGKENKKPTLQLTVRIVSQESCKGDRDVFSENFDVVTEYRNSGTKSLAIYTGEDYSSTDRVAKSLEDLKAKRYEANDSWDVFPSDASGDHLLGSPPHQEPTRILAPGQTTESRVTFGLAVRKNAADAIPMTVPPGVHYVEIDVRTKVDSERISRNVTPDSMGHLRWATVSSDPLRIELPANPVLKDCYVPPASQPLK